MKQHNSIENLFKHSLENKYLEQFNYIASNHIEFIPIAIMDNTKLVKSFTIKMKEFDIDLSLLKYFIERYEEWINNKEITNSNSNLNFHFTNSYFKHPF